MVYDRQDVALVFKQIFIYIYLTELIDKFVFLKKRERNEINGVFQDIYLNFMFFFGLFKFYCLSIFDIDQYS